MGAVDWPVILGWLTNPGPALPSLVSRVTLLTCADHALTIDHPPAPLRSCHHWPALAMCWPCAPYVLTTDHSPEPPEARADQWWPMLVTPVCAAPLPSLMSPLRLPLYPFVMQMSPLNVPASALSQTSGLECRWSVLKWNTHSETENTTEDWINYWSNGTWNLHHLAPESSQGPGVESEICPVTPDRAQNNSCPVWSWLAIGKCSPY